MFGGRSRPLRGPSLCPPNGSRDPRIVAASSRLFYELAMSILPRIYASAKIKYDEILCITSKTNLLRTCQGLVSRRRTMRAADNGGDLSLLKHLILYNFNDNFLHYYRLPPPPPVAADAGAVRQKAEN